MIQGLNVPSNIISPSPNMGSKLTEKQSEMVTALLSNYDTDNLSAAEAKDIVTQIQKMGIRPGGGLASALEHSGVLPDELAQKAGIGEAAQTKGPTKEPGHPPQAQERNQKDEAIVALISAALDLFSDASSAQTLWSILKPALEDAGYDTSKGIVDYRA